LFIEIARFWASIAEYNASLDRYEIRGIMGPDEFHTALPGPAEAEPGLDNNAYTNVMAAWVLATVEYLLDRLSPPRRHELRRRLGITDEELALMDSISRRMRVVIGEDGIISQFEGYENLEELDWQDYRQRYEDIQRLDRILESEGDTANRYKVSKQADVLMLFYLFSAEELAGLFKRLDYPFDPEMIPRNIEYYAQRTTDGSTLSYVVRSWVEARANRAGSWQRFLDALEVDVGDVQRGTTAEGIHLGAMAGTVDILHRCYTGIETRNDVLQFAPALPAEIRRLQISIRYRQQRIAVTVDHGRLRLESLPRRAAPVTVCYRGDERVLRPGEDLEYELR